MEEKYSGPVTSLQGNNGKISESNNDRKTPLSGLGGVCLIIVVLLTVILGIANSLGWIR